MGAWSSNRLRQAATLGLVSIAFGCGESAAPGPSATGGAGVGGTAAGAGAGGTAAGAGGLGTAAGASAGGTAAGASAACPTVDVDDQPGIVANIDGETIEFRRQPIWYGGRPPLLDLSAATDAVGWVSFRIVIDPPGDAVVPGVYQSDPNNVTYVIMRRESGDYDTIDNNASTICVTEAGTGAGARVAGTFSSTLEKYDGTSTLVATGTFSGELGAP